MDFKILRVTGRQILDSRGNPTVEAEVATNDATGIFSAPSGASKGGDEAFELRDGGREFHGKGVIKAVENINKIISPALRGMDVREQRKIDEKIIAIDRTKDKSILGGNACIAVSIAVCKCASSSLAMPPYRYLNENASILPIPFMNIINGGMHAGNELAIQEHLIAPVGAKNFHSALRMGCEVYYTLRKIIEDRYGKNAINVGDEGGFAPPLKSSFDALELIMKAIEENGYTEEIKLAIDASATNFHRDGFYFIGDEKYNTMELLDFYIDLSQTFPIVSIEDCFDERDWDGFTEITRKIGDKVQIVGDDLFVTNRKKLRRGIKKGACNALLLKPNQIGTLSEAIDVAQICFENKYHVMVSHRSGETCDDFIADLAVALGCGQIKAGAPARGERVVKYNRLLRIEDELEKARYAKWDKWGL